MLKLSRTNPSQEETPSENQTLLKAIKTRIGWRTYLCLVAIIASAGFIGLQWAAIIESVNRINHFLGIGIPFFITFAIAYSISIRLWHMQALRQSHKWLGVLVAGVGILSLISIFNLSGQLGPFSIQTGLGSALVQDSTWTTIQRIAGLLTVSGFLLAPHAFLKLSQKTLLLLMQLIIIGSAKLNQFAQHQVNKINKSSTYPAPEDEAIENNSSQSDVKIQSDKKMDFDEDIGGRPTSDDQEGPTTTSTKLGSSVEKPRQNSLTESTLNDRPKGKWFLPNLSLLQQGNWDKSIGTELQERGSIIVETLMDYGIEAEIGNINPGPTVTQFGIYPRWQLRYKENIQRNSEGQPVFDQNGQPIVQRDEVSRTRLKVDKIASLDKDLSLALKAPIRIETSMPTTGMVGIEVPNSAPSTITLRSAIESAPADAIENGNLIIPVGIGAGGESIVADLVKMPHLLIAGSTGSGKSVFINAILSALLLNVTPEDIQLILIDPKRVELSRYEDIPHLASPVLIAPKEVVNALKWTLEQMSERLDLLAEARTRDIQSYNQSHSEKLPYLVLVIDELADLMMTSAKAVEQSLVRLAQMGRATGIHLIVATQRPSVDVVTGLIKANFPTRVSFAVSSSVDSRTILDIGGAEKLLGKGDLFYMAQDNPRPTRVQGAFVGEEEVDRLVKQWTDQSDGYQPAPLPDMDAFDEALVESTTTSRKEPLLQEASDLAAMNGGRISTSLLQRRLGIGYPRAARLKDMLYEEGVITNDNQPKSTT